MIRIDAHQHFWRYLEQDYGWIDETMSSLKRDFVPEHLKSLLKQHRIDGCVAVQARETIEETYWLLELADKNEYIKAVIGWIDLCSNNLEIELDKLAGKPKLKGFRHVLQDESDEFMLRPEFVRGLKTLGQYNYSYDLLVQASQLSAVCQLVEQLPVMRLVLDHICKPNIATQEWQPWADHIEKLASYKHLNCKVSGMVTEAHWNEWNTSQMDPYLSHIAQCFGEDRLLFGSDWPVCTLAADYRQVTELVENFFDQYSHTATGAVMGENAVDFYQLAR